MRTRPPRITAVHHADRAGLGLSTRGTLSDSAFASSYPDAASKLFCFPAKSARGYKCRPRRPPLPPHSPTSTTTPALTPSTTLHTRVSSTTSSSATATHPPTPQTDSDGGSSTLLKTLAGLGLGLALTIAVVLVFLHMRHRRRTRRRGPCRPKRPAVQLLAKGERALPPPPLTANGPTVPPPAYQRASSSLPPPRVKESASLPSYDGTVLTPRLGVRPPRSAAQVHAAREVERRPCTPSSAYSAERTLAGGFEFEEVVCVGGPEDEGSDGGKSGWTGIVQLYLDSRPIMYWDGRRGGGESN